jgi:hypothetical protein
VRKIIEENVPQNSHCSFLVHVVQSLCISVTENSEVSKTQSMSLVAPGIGEL